MKTPQTTGENVLKKSINHFNYAVSASLKIATSILIQLDCFEQCLEISSSKSLLRNVI